MDFLHEGKFGFQLFQVFLQGNLCRCCFVHILSDRPIWVFHASDWFKAHSTCINFPTGRRVSMSCSAFFLASTASSHLAFKASNWPSTTSLAATDMSCNVGMSTKTNFNLPHLHSFWQWVMVRFRTLWTLICSTALVRAFSCASYSCLRPDGFAKRLFNASISVSSSLFFDSRVLTYSKTCWNLFWKH